MILRQMTINDYDDVLRLLEKNNQVIKIDSKEKIEKLLRRCPCISLVCQCDNRIIGAVISGCDGRTGYIYHVAVEREHKIRGIALELVNEVLKRLKAEGIDTCRLFAIKGEYDDKDFWEHVGWNMESELVTYSKGLE